ncbi:hypothetical protein [Thermostaphylospora chromogena]|uniref:Uncharacterized protein n=1 Tax=Thermostaphylospora chromogena TaxID=35622 RepID=A0A1H1DEJ8_9ACTN|nr:hypothetical protein [Thermostaphylospora chromogena]SDQ74679.1 hypothetical protein SAMN04489764_1960 [Thermostaphylospora chromogena]
MDPKGTKGLARFTSWIGGLLDRADRSLCMEEDEFAHRRGWTVTKTGFGARLYRDPRFDLLKATLVPETLTAEADRGIEEPGAEEVRGNVVA